MSYFENELACIPQSFELIIFIWSVFMQESATENIWIKYGGCAKEPVSGQQGVIAEL